MNLLLVDDNQDTREVIEELIVEVVEPEPSIILASNGLDGLIEFFDYTRAIDLLVTDYRMPKMDGLWLVRQIRKRDEHLPIILLTGADFSQDIKRELGCSTKFVARENCDHLIDMLQQIIE